MTAIKMKERTIAFFEVVAVTPGGHERMAHQDWPKVFATMAGTTLQQRAWDGSDRRVFGNVYTLEQVDRLTLHRVRDPSDWLQKVNFESGDVDDIEAAANEGIVDTSVVHFAEFGNLVGMIQGGMSAPGHTVLEGWLNHMAPFGKDVQLGVVPVRLQAEKERLDQAVAASTFELRLGAKARGDLSKTYQEAKDAGQLPAFGDWLRSAPVDPELTLTVKVASPRGAKKFAGARAKLQKQVQELFPVLPDSSDVRAEATLFHGFGDQTGPAKLTELVEHAMTVKRRVPALNEQGESIRVQASFQIIESVIIEHEDQLRQATGT